MGDEVIADCPVAVIQPCARVACDPVALDEAVAVVKNGLRIGQGYGVPDDGTIAMGQRSADGSCYLIMGNGAVTEV